MAENTTTRQALADLVLLVEITDRMADEGGASMYHADTLAQRNAVIRRLHRHIEQAGAAGVKVDARPSIDVEAMLTACVPGGSICDPQQVADAIRAYFAAPGVPASHEGQQQ